MSTRPLRDRIAGVKAGKDVRGDALEFEPPAKIKSTARFALSKHLLAQSQSPAITDLQITAQNVAAKGDLLKKRYQNNSYSAEGTVTYFVRDHVTDTVSQKQTSKFELKFEDALDRNGFPDVNITEFSIY
jgi:hypothetical protein